MVQKHGFLLIAGLTEEQNLDKGADEWNMETLTLEG